MKYYLKYPLPPSLHYYEGIILQRSKEAETAWLKLHSDKLECFKNSYPLNYFRLSFEQYPHVLWQLSKNLLCLHLFSGFLFTYLQRLLLCLLLFITKYVFESEHTLHNYCKQVYNDCGHQIPNIRPGFLVQQSMKWSRYRRLDLDLNPRIPNQFRDHLSYTNLVSYLNYSPCRQCHRSMKTTKKSNYNIDERPIE